MNKSTAIFLIDPSVRCISAAYDKTKSGSKEIPTEIKSFKTFDSTLAVGDLIVVPTDTRWGFTIAKVTAVDLHVDFDDHTLMRWVVSKITINEYENILQQELGVMDKIADADREARRKKLAAELTEHVPDFRGFSLQAAALTQPAPPPSGFEGEAGSGRGGQQSYVPPAPGTYSDEDMPF